MDEVLHHEPSGPLGRGLNKSRSLKFGQVRHMKSWKFRNRSLGPDISVRLANPVKTLLNWHRFGYSESKFKFLGVKVNPKFKRRQYFLTDLNNIGISNQVIP